MPGNVGDAVNKVAVYGVPGSVALTPLLVAANAPRRIVVGAIPLSLLIFGGVTLFNIFQQRVSQPGN